MSYAGLTSKVISGTAIKQSPNTRPISVPGNLSTTLDVDVATTGNLGVVQIGSGISISPAGIISATGSSISGNWTPMIMSWGTGTVLLNTKSGKYSKVGQLVTCTFDVEVTNISWGGDKDVLMLTNLPFTSVPGTGYVGSMYFSYFQNMGDNVDYISGSVLPSSTTLDLWFTNQQAKSMTRMNQGTLKVGARLVGSIEYFSAI